MLPIVTVLAVLVAQGEAGLSLGAPRPGTIVTIVTNNTETVPDTHQAGRKASEILPRLGTAQHSMHSNHSEELGSLQDKHDSATERSASTVYNFQSTTMQEQRSFGDLLNLARIKYLGRDLRRPTAHRQIEKIKPKEIAERNQRRHGLLHKIGQGRSRQGRVTLGSSGSEDQRIVSPVTTHIPPLALQVEQIKIDSRKLNRTGVEHSSTIVPDTGVTNSVPIISDTSVLDPSTHESDSMALTEITKVSDSSSSPSLGTSKHVDKPPEDTIARNRVTKTLDISPLMGKDHPELLMVVVNHSKEVEFELETVDDTSNTTTEQVASRTMQMNNIHSKESTKSILEPKGINQPNKLKNNSDFQYQHVSPGQYQEVHPGQYHEVHPGQYQETNPGQYYEVHPGQDHEVHPGQVQLDVEFNPEDETKTYNVHKKTGEYIIGEVGKIDVNNGQTLEGVRYTAVDGMVDQARIAEILQHFFGTKTT